MRAREKERRSPSLHVLVVAQYFPPDLGGAAIRAYNVTKGLLLNGCKVTVVAAFPHYPYGEIPEEYKWKPIKVEQLGKIRVLRTLMPPIRSTGFLSRLLLIGSFALTSLWALPWVGRVDVIWASSWIPGIIYGKVKMKPAALNVDDLTVEDVIGLGLLERKTFRVKFAERVFRFCYVKGDAITPISPGYVETISRKYCVDKSRIQVVRGGVDLSIFERSPNNCRPGQKFTVLYAGVLGLGYDFDQVFKAAKIVEAKNRDVEFVLHGGGECVGYVRDQIKEQNLTNVKLSDRILSDRREVAKLMNSADVLILPMRDFGRPYLGIASKIYEYQTVGKPIICCADGYPATYVMETGSGIVVKPGDHEALAEAVVYLKENSDIAQAMGDNGRNHIEKELSIESIGLSMKRILETIKRKSHA